MAEEQPHKAELVAEVVICQSQQAAVCWANNPVASVDPEVRTRTRLPEAVEGTS